MLVPNLFSAFKGTSIIRNILATMSLLLWCFFTYELYFLKGTSNQGSISPTILTIVSFLLVFNFVYNIRHNMNQIPLMVMCLGLIFITAGTSSSYYKLLVMAGLALIGFSMYIMNSETRTRFGYNMTPIDTYGRINPEYGVSSLNTELHQRNPLDYPRPSNNY